MKDKCSIFIPVYNEADIIEDNVQKLLRYLSSKSIDAKIIIGSNGSTDLTPSIIQRMAVDNDKIAAFHLPRKGVGKAFAHGIQLSDTEYIVCQDADLSVELDFIPLALEFLEKSDMVIGCKRLRKQNRLFIRKFGSDFFVFAVSVLLGTGVSDFSIGAKAFRRSFVEKHLKKLDSGSGYVLELVQYAARARRRVVEVPVDCEDTRKSHFNLAAETIYKFSHLIRCWLTAGKV